MSKKSFYFVLIFHIFLLGCETEKSAPPLEGERISFFEISQKIKIDSTISNKPFRLPEAEINTTWSQIEDNPAHLIGHYSLENISNLKRIWRTSVGASATKDSPFISSPILHNQRIFTMDRRGLISAIDSKNGDVLWSKKISKKRTSFIRGGLVIFEDNLIATYGSDIMMALDVRNGKQVWTKKTEATPFKSAPIISNQTVYALTIDNRIYAFNARTGKIVWFHDGLLEQSSLLKQSNPSIRGNTLIVPYSSGNIFSFDEKTKKTKWSRKISSPAPRKKLSYETGLVAAPVIDNDAIFALGTNDMLSALSHKKGKTIWSLPIGGYETPLISGAWLFVVDKNNVIYCLEKTTGKLRWKKQLLSKNDDDEQMKWFAPRLVSGKLVLFSSKGNGIILNPSSGKQLTQDIFENSFEEEIAHPPIIVNKIIYIITKDATLYAFQ